MNLALCLDSPRRFWLAFGFALVAGLPAGLAPQVPGPSPAIERGAFRILVDAKEVGREDFEIERKADQIRARARLALEADGQKVEETALLTLSPAYEPRSYEWKRTKPAGQFVRVRFDGMQAALEFPLSGTDLDQREFLFETTQVVILDNNFFHHYLFLLRHYDFTRGGTQSVRILIPQEVLPALVTLEDMGMENVTDGQTQRSLRRLRLRTEDLEVWLWVDENAALVRLTVPQSKVEVLRTQP